jgi:N-acylneuraminate cytidylyltransferase
MRALAVIPARGGSKRLPGKNIRDFAGKPMLAWSVEAAHESGLFDEVMVSTDSEEIAEVARAAGASVPFLRSAETADDHAIIIDVMAEVVDRYEADGRRFERLCCILATAPLLRSSTLRSAAALMDREGFDTVFPVVAFGYPIQRALRRDEAGRTAMRQPEHYASRSQDLEPAFHDAAQFYWMTREVCVTKQSIFAGRAGSFVIDAMEAQDIDTLTDWRLAELKMQLAMSGQ